MDLEVNMFKCPFCGAEFLRKQDLDAHVISCPYQYEKPKEEEPVKNEEPKEVKKNKKR